MPLRCLLFSPGAETLRTIGQVLNELEIEAESCAQAVEAVEKVTARPFQLVIIDWSSQPEAGFLLNTARNRKPAERPLTLAIVSDDASVPTALQAGANSILRQPLLVNQVKDTLATARDLLRAKLEPPVASAAAAVLPTEVQSTLHAGEFLQPSGSVPSPQFETESSDVQKSLDQAAAAEIDPLQDLEPTAAPVAQSKPSAYQSAPTHPQAAPASVPTPAPAAMPDDEPRGLAWYLKTRAKSQPADEPEPEPAAEPETAQLLGYGQTPSYGTAAVGEDSAAQADSQEREPQPSAPQPDPQQREESALFAYISGEKSDSEKKPSPPRPWIKKVAIAAVLLVAAAAAYLTVPQATVQKALGRATTAGRRWLHPQPATPAQIQAHEVFGRAGDEYKLPVAENIPDANTDPSQIRVLPVVDPTVKPPKDGTGTPDPSVAQANPTTPGPGDPAQPDQNQPAATQGAEGQSADGQVAQNQTPENQSQSNPAQPAQASTSPAPVAASPLAAGQPAVANAQSATSPNLVATNQTNPAQIPTQALQTGQTSPPASLRPARSVTYPDASGSNPSAPNVAGIPSSLKSSLAQMSPEASGNKPTEAALPSIEPVNLPEAAARGLLVEGPSPAYPPSARGQTGTVTLQVLIGRDGAVQDAKFLQGSLAFARPAIDAVKQWRFKPYLMNGRPASTQTMLTIGFKPAP